MDYQKLPKIRTCIKEYLCGKNTKWRYSSFAKLYACYFAVTVYHLQCTDFCKRVQSDLTRTIDVGESTTVFWIFFSQTPFSARTGRTKVTEWLASIASINLQAEMAISFSSLKKRIQWRFLHDGGFNINDNIVWCMFAEHSKCVMRQGCTFF